jgi:hypothetical protein
VSQRLLAQPQTTDLKRKAIAKGWAICFAWAGEKEAGGLQQRVSAHLRAFSNKSESSRLSGPPHLLTP